MQLRRYWAVVRRRWPIIAAVVLLAALGGGLLALLSPRQYTVEVRLLLNRVPTQPATAAPDFRYDDYYRFVATEYVLDDLVQEVQGNRFAGRVLERLRERGIPGMDEERVMRALRAERAHRILTVEVTTGGRDLTHALAATVEGLLTQGRDEFKPPDGSRIEARTIHIDAMARSNLARLLLVYALQVALASLLGLGLAFLLDYLDDRVRDADDAAALGLPLLGQVPAAARRGR